MKRLTLLQEAMTPDVLNQSWRRLRIEHTPWSPTVNRKELQRDLLKHIIECRDQVLSGIYEPQSLRQYPLRKPNGKQRIISAQYLQDKLVQRALLLVLEPKAERLFHDDSYGYRPRRGVSMALGKTRERVKIGLDWLVDADITAFFDHIPHQQLRAIISHFVADKAALKLIDKWLKIGAHHSSLLRKRRGISQGAILSPLFCNLYLHQLDMSLSKANIPFVRYADDFLLFTPSKQAAEEALQYASQTLTSLGLTIHPEKTQIVRSHPRVSFLGEKLPLPAR